MAALWRIPGKQRADPIITALIRFGNLIQKEGQISIRIEVVGLCSFNQAINNCTGLSATGRIGKEEILASHDKRLYAAFRPIVTNLQTAIQQEVG